MTDSKHSGVIQTDKPISSYVRVESLLLSTPAADAYRAYDLGQKQSCSLWISRGLLPSGAPEILQFLRRFEAIDNIDPPICVIGGYGVDSDGRAFALFPPLDGYKVTAGNLEGAEAERRFTTCLRLVSILHENGISCGDICSDSFWVTRDGELLFIGLLGMVTTDSREALNSAPASSLPFVAPELFKGEESSVRSDVFSLGVLGYNLFSGHHPYGVEDLQYGTATDFTPLSEHVGTPPVWAEELLGTSLQMNPEDRYQTATDMLKALKGIRARSSADEAMPVPRRKSAAAIRGAEAASVPEVHKPQDLAPAISKPRTSSSSTSQIVLFLLVLVIFGSAILLLFPIFSDDKVDPDGRRLEQGIDSLRDPVQGESLGEDLDAIADPNLALKEKEKYLQNLSKSNDPIAHMALITSALEAPNEQFRAFSEKALLERANRLGMARSSEQVRQWLRTLRAREYPPSYEPILQSLDRALPLEERFASLRRAYSTNPIVGLRLTAALAFDLDKLEEFQGVLAQLVGDSLRLEEAESKATISLIMAHQDLSLVFGEDVLQHREKVPDEDITWLLRLLAVQRDIHVRAVANLALERDIVSPVQQFFLELVRDRAELDANIVTALIRGAAGSLTSDDLGSFGRWYDVQSEEVLLAALVDLEDPKLVRQAIDILAAKSIVTEPSASLVQWVKENYWDEREKFGKLIGVFGNLERVEEEEVAANLKLIDEVVRDSDLLDILIDSNNPTVVLTVVSKYSDLLGLGTLLTLLDNRDPQVRIGAVRALKGFNDIGALKIILDHYESERDQSVREVYKETFWVIKRREENKDGQFGSSR